MSVTPPVCAERAVVIGASTGALRALAQVLAPLPADFGEAILVVVHLPAEIPSRLDEVLAHRCRLPIKEAEDKEPILPGTVYLAPPDYHLLVDRGPVCALSIDLPESFSRPSIDVLFSSAADEFGARLTGIVLTGSNADGARGLSAIEHAGGRTLVECPDTAEWPAMPLAALEACPEAEVCALSELAGRLVYRSSGVSIIDAEREA
jgi:two-component system, chemotaxis family, protein-glutamate methylesterase/glutaminase